MSQFHVDDVCQDLAKSALKSYTKPTLQVIELRTDEVLLAVVCNNYMRKSVCSDHGIIIPNSASFRR